MTDWMGMVLRGGLVFVKAALREAVDGITAPDVAGAKAQVEAAIQAQRRLPGVMRRWLCQDVRRIHAPTVDDLKARLHAEIARIG